MWTAKRRHSSFWRSGHTYLFVCVGFSGYGTKISFGKRKSVFFNSGWGVRYIALNSCQKIVNVLLSNGNVVYHKTEHMNRMTYLHLLQ